jgi:hypothetical protein
MPMMRMLGEIPSWVDGHVEEDKYHDWRLRWKWKWCEKLEDGVYRLMRIKEKILKIQVWSDYLWQDGEAQATLSCDGPCGGEGQARGLAPTNRNRWWRASEDCVVTDRARPFETMDYLYQSFEKWKMQSQRSRIFDSLIIKKGIDQGKGIIDLGLMCLLSCMRMSQWWNDFDVDNPRLWCWQPSKWRKRMVWRYSYWYSFSICNWVYESRTIMRNATLMCLFMSRCLK